MEFPTCVGMNRSDFALYAMRKRVPHMRGDEPFFCFFHQGGIMSSPHAWG